MWVWHQISSDGEAPILEIGRLRNTPSLPLLLGPLSHRVIVFVKVLSMGQIGLLENFVYLIKSSTKKSLKNTTQNVNIN